jgi:hypothetical protein
MLNLSGVQIDRQHTQAVECERRNRGCTDLPRVRVSLWAVMRSNF